MSGHLPSHLRNPSMNIDKTRIILTGAASGIGKALFAQLATYDAQILAVDINPVELPPAKATLHAHIADLTKPDDVDTFFQVALEKMGGVDIFIANAGFAYFEKIDKPDWEHI